MLTVKLDDIALRETWTSANPTQRAHSTFPFLGSTENRDTSLVYFELAAGDELGSHTDSAEEVLLILEGKVEVTVGDETAAIEAPAVALVPEMEPHNLRNIGDAPAKVAGFFPSRYLVATFDHVWQPDETRVIDTEAIEASFAEA